MVAHIFNRSAGKVEKGHSLGFIGRSTHPTCISGQWHTLSQKVSRLFQRVHWQASLVLLVSCRPVRDTVFKKKKWITPWKWHLSLSSDTHTHKRKGKLIPVVRYRMPGGQQMKGGLGYIPTGEGLCQWRRPYWGLCRGLCTKVLKLLREL